MPNRKESLEGRPPVRSAVAEPAKPRVRIARACDRCKIKKSKCDGNTPCSNCLASESTCEYSARRRREARDWYLGMQGIIDEALQRLYRACRDGSGFPGVVPDEENGRVSTGAILRGLGLSPPPVDNERPSGSGSDSILDTQAMLFTPRSFYPPGVQSQLPNLSQGMTTSSALTPLSTTSDERLTLGDENPETGQRGQRSSAMELDGEDGMPSALPDGLAESLPNGPGQELQDGVDANIDPAMMLGERGGYVEGSMYSNSILMRFENGVQQGAHGQQMLMQPVSQQGVEPVTKSLVTTEQQVWHGRYDDAADRILPWPGNLPSMSGKEGADARRGFDATADRKR